MEISPLSFGQCQLYFIIPIFASIAMFFLPISPFANIDQIISSILQAGAVNLLLTNYMSVIFGGRYEILLRYSGMLWSFTFICINIKNQ